jgi:hypothetical protein
MGPEELLAQIRSLLDQYLALGGDTPVAAEAQAFAQAIDSATGGGGEEMGAAEVGAPPAEEGGELPPGGGMPPPDQSEAGPPMMPGGEPMPAGGPQDFGTASSMALDDLKKKKGKASY